MSESERGRAHLPDHEMTTDEQSIERLKGSQVFCLESSTGLHRPHRIFIYPTAVPAEGLSSARCPV